MAKKQYSKRQKERNKRPKVILGRLPFENEADLFKKPKVAVEEPAKTTKKEKVAKNNKLRDSILNKIESEFKIKINSSKYSFYELWEFYDKYKI